MPTLELLFIVIISILVVSVVLSVIDWVYLSSLSSKTQFLEREVEKKTLEFDVLKKERASSRQPTISNVSVIESTEPITVNEDTPQQHQSIEDTIQIVRNVRGNFERTEHFTHDISPYPQEPSGTQLPSPPHGGSPETAAPVTFATAPGNDSLPLKAPPAAPVHSSAVTAAESASGGVPQPSRPSVFRLYSATKHDADFDALWHNITGSFENCAQPRIIVDLAGINYMYDKEMDYLEKIKYLLTGRGGTFEFINCDRELLSIFNNRPHLRVIVR